MLTFFKTESHNVILCLHGVVVTTIKIVATEIMADNFFFSSYHFWNFFLRFTMSYEISQ